MSHRPRRFLRSLILVVLATGFAACHFHGHGHCWTPRVPVRHCR